MTINTNTPLPTSPTGWVDIRPTDPNSIYANPNNTWD